MRVRYSNPEQSPASHYNPDPLARRADMSVNGATEQHVLFPHSFHQNNFWELTVRVSLKRGSNAIRFSSEEQPNFDGKTYASDEWDVPLRSKYAPLIDRLTIAPFAGRPSFRAVGPAGDVGGTVPPTLPLTLGPPAILGQFTPGVAKDYSASTT